MNRVIEEDLEKIKQSLIGLSDKIKDKTFLITGGAGFLGSWICDSLNVFGAKIICVDNLITGSIKNISHLINQKNFKFIQHDITKPINIEENVDYVIHMASIASPPIFQRRPLETLNANVFGTINLLEFSKGKKVKTFLFTSTSEVYGNPPDNAIPTPETFPGLVYSFGPRAMYDEGKRAAEAYIYSFFEQYKEPSVKIVRIFNTYGPRLDFNSDNVSYARALSKFLNQAINNKVIEIYGDGNQTRSFCYITDQIEGLIKFLLTDSGERVMNIGNDKEITIIELAQKIINATNSNSKIVLNAKPNYNLTHDPTRRCPDITRARKILGFSPKVSLEEGIKRTFLWFKEEKLK